MVKKAKSSGLDFNKALKAHAKDEVTYGSSSGELPPGITNGIAQLKDARIGTYGPGTRYPGQNYLLMAGIVVSPSKAAVVRKAFVNGKEKVIKTGVEHVLGLRTQKMWSLCATKNRDGEVVDLDHNVGVALNEIKKIGGKECCDGIESMEDLKAVLVELVKEKPYFKFSTTPKKVDEKNPTEGVWENWNGSRGLEDYSPEESEGMTDNTEEEDEEDEDEEEEAQEKESEEEDEDEEEEESEEEESEDEEESEEKDELDELLEKCDTEDKKAQTALLKKAKAAGILNAEKLDTWEEVVQAIRDAEKGEDEEEEESEDEEEALEPSAGDVYRFKPAKAKKAVECEVKKVDKKNQTVDLKNLDDGRSLYKGIPFGDLLSD